jgi:hypothetical protein
MTERPHDLTSEDHDWKECNCRDCDIIWHEVQLSRSE